MSLRNWIGAVALTSLALTPSMALAQAPKVSDSTLDNRIEERIKASSTLKGDDIDVSVDNGVVTLTGKVRSAAHKTRAATLAKIAGVTRVDNKLDVDTTIGHKMDDTKDKAEGTAGKAGNKAEKAGEKTKDAAAKVGEKTKNAAGEVGEAVTDAWITTKLKADFVNEDTLKGSDINVDTNNHIVTLKGTVTSAAGKARAEQIAKTTKGVSRVIDQLVVAPKK